MLAGLALVLVAVALIGIGCGGSEDSSGSAPPPPARPEDFPKPAGLTVKKLRAKLGAEGPILAPSVSQFETGPNRFGFALFDRARAQIADAPVAIYVARAGGGKLHGPYVAKYESLEVKAQYQSQSVASDPDAAKSLYVSQLKGLEPGRYDVIGVTRLDGRLVAATPAGPGLTVTAKSAVPGVGSTAPRIHTLTKTDVDGDLTKIDTRRPTDSMHDDDFADVLGKKPVVLLFATPALCQSRVCGPVVDIAEQVKAEHGEGVAFIHQEIYRDNKIDKGFRPQVSAFHLPTEPWLFAFDAKGKLVARIEGAFSAEELQKAVDTAKKD